MALRARGSRIDHVVRTPLWNGWLNPSGTQPPKPGELLGGKRSQSILDALSRDYDVVILDTPPLLAAPAAAVLGASAGGVVLAVRAGQTERGAAQEAIQQLDLVGARIVSAVLNDPDAKAPSYGGNYSSTSTMARPPGREPAMTARVVALPARRRDSRIDRNSSTRFARSAPVQPCEPAGSVGRAL
jgi:Mrp family chromosome partitioning ATPase